MKKLTSFLSVFLVCCMLASAFASCGDSGNKDENTSDTSDALQSTEQSSDGNSESETETEIREVVVPDGIWGNSIAYAYKIQNGVQSYYPDGVARDSYVVENLNMQAEFALGSGKSEKLSYLKNRSGGTYLSDTMDVFVRMKNGKTYFASDSDKAARANIYRIGYYYYDVRILEQSFYSDAVASKELSFDAALFSYYNSACVSSYKVRDGVIKYAVSGSDPYFSCSNNAINFSAEDYNAIQLTVKSSASEQAQLFVVTDKKPSYNATQSVMFNVKNDGEFHTYNIMLSALPDSTGNVIGFRFDLGKAGEVIEVKDMKAVKLESDAPYVLLDRTWHTYPDKVHQELHFVAPEGQDGIDALGMVTEISADTVAKLIVKDKNGTHDSLDGIDWASAEYVGFDVKDAGIFGYIMPADDASGSIMVTLDGGKYTVVQEASPENGEIRSPVEVDSTANDFFMGQRLYTDESHSFDAFIKEAEWERNPLQSIGGDSYVGYDALRGAYLFTIGGTSFNPAFFSNQNQHFYADVSLTGEKVDRPIYIRTATTSGCLEGAAIMDAGGMLLPIPLEVSKNFGEGEEPIMNYSDETYGETVFPFVATANTEYDFTVLNLYQNWGKFPLKQLSSIAYYAPYYHLSVGITETSCISPWYVRGRTLWTLPDFRAISAPYWFELDGDAFKNEPQHTNAGLFEIIQYTDADGNFIASENYKNVIDASGPVYAEVKMDYLSDDGKMKISYNHLEMPQTDELRTYYTVEIKVLDDISIKNFKEDFAFYAWETDRRYVGYLDASNERKEAKYSATDDVTEYILGKSSPYFGNYGIKSSNATNLGFLIHSSEIVLGGQTFNGNFVVTEEAKNRFALSLDLGEITLKKGDYITLNILMIPWGSHLSTNSSNLATLRQNTAIDPYKVVAIDGEVIDSVYMPRIKTTNGKSAEFTISGGANNASVRIYGFNKLTAPKIYEKVDGEWVEYEVSSINSPDATGVKHYYDGYSVYYDGDGTYSYAFAVNMDESRERTFKIEADKDFEPWPEIDSGSKDPINYYMDASELAATFTNAIPGVSSAVLSEDEEYIRITGDGKNVPEVSISVFSATDTSPTGQYLVVKYRIPNATQDSYQFEFFASTINSSAKGTDSIWLPGNLVDKDGEWHVLVVDATAYRPETFMADKNGKYFCQYIRFDVFNSPMSVNSCVDIAYVGICDSIEKLCELNSDMETITVNYKSKTEIIDVKTGEAVSSTGSDSGSSGSGTGGSTQTPSTTEITSIKNPSTLIDPQNAQGYSISKVPYFARIDSINGYGPNCVTGTAFDAGSNDVAGTVSIAFNNSSTSDKCLVLAGWNLVQGGVEKYVWSADGGKTWNDAKEYKSGALKAASSGMISYTTNKYGSAVDFSANLEKSSYQGSLNGPASANGLAADLSAFAGQTVDVTFAVVPASDTDTLCILAHVTGVKVASE
ncbi:MAG: hypothetical protein IJY39_04260 [Clostridia bacterium]|nr:hypothetical protein [Clostridia bacterium]